MTQERPAWVAKFHGAQQRGDVSAERPQAGAIVRARIHRHDQEDRGAGEWRGNGLRNGRRVTRCIGRGHRIALHRVASPARTREISLIEMTRSQA
jgi:hypothetical protein